MRYFILAAVAVALAGCCGSGSAPAAQSASGVELEPVVAQPVRGICIPIPFTGCKVCLGVSCDTPTLVEPAVFGTPVQRAAPASAEPCPQVYAAPDPCGSASDCPDGSCDVPYAEAWGSSSDAFDYGTPPALQR